MFEHNIHDNKGGSSSSSSLNQLKLNFGKDENKLKAPASSSSEMSRDIALWFALDLQPFDCVDDIGFQFFFKKNFPSVVLPCPSTISRTALKELYIQVQARMKQEMASIPAVCLMFDGWTDKHHGRGYLGIRATYITDDWELRLVTISCRPLESHTSQAIANHVQGEMKELIDIKKVKVFTTHDGAENMVKSSKVLRSNNFTHCAAHCLNLLLMTDGMDANEVISALLQQCRSIVQSLHFKAHVIEDELLKLKDQKFIDELMQKISAVNQVMQVEGQISQGIPESQVLYLNYFALTSHTIFFISLGC
jgi:peroxiredoxin family protein